MLGEVSPYFVPPPIRSGLKVPETGFQPDPEPIKVSVPAGADDLLKPTTDSDEDELTDATVDIESRRVSTGRLSREDSKGLCPKKDKKGWLQKARGILCALVATLCISLSTYLVKILKGLGYPIYLSVFWRFAGILVLSTPILIFCRFYLKTPVFDIICPMNNRSRWKTLGLIIFRCVVGTAGFVFQYAALLYISMGDTSVITYSSPIVVLLFSCICLHEKCGYYPTFVAVLTICGVLLIARPSFIFPTNVADKSREKEKYKGILLALVAMLCTAMTIVLLRFLRHVHYTLISVIFGTIGLLTGLILSLTMLDEKGSNSFKMPEHYLHTFLFLGLAVLSFLGQIFLIFALKLEEAGPVSVVRSMDCVVSFAIEAMAGIVPSLYSIGGAFIVILAVVLIAFRKWLLDKEQEDPTHPCVKRFWFVLK